LGPFQVDRLPYPNDPNAAPRVNVTRAEAAQLCAERGARLCTELEWERVCKGPANDAFPTGGQWDQRCGEAPKACASGFDVLAMASWIREWTASDILPEADDLPRRASVRGAPKSAPAAAHGCARRSGIDPATRAEDLGFRCCRGAPNAARVVEPRAGEMFTKTRLTAERLTQLLAEDPTTRSLSGEVKYFREPEAARTVLERGKGGDTQGFSFTVAPLVWRPASGVEFLLVTARVGERTSLLLAYHVLGEDRYKLAASFVMKDEPGPVALAYGLRERLHFSTCWGCLGETGKILFREPEGVSIQQP
jgi:hypothetical protein